MSKPRPIVFASDITGPAVGFVELDGLTIAVWADDPARVREALGRAIPGDQALRGYCHCVPLNFTEMEGCIRDHAKRPDSWFTKTRTQMVDPTARYRRHCNEGMTDAAAYEAAKRDNLDGLYFAVGGPITPSPSANRASALVILGDWPK